MVDYRVVIQEIWKIIFLAQGNEAILLCLTFILVHLW